MRDDKEQPASEQLLNVKCMVKRSERLSLVFATLLCTNLNKPGKIRVVFDAAARFRSVSYNDLFLRGPPSILSLVSVLLRSRQLRVALSAYMAAFYHRVGVAKHHHQRFVYRKFGSETQVKTYQFTTLIFGAICLPSAAVFPLQHAANKCANFPIIAEKMKDNF